MHVVHALRVGGMEAGVITIVNALQHRGIVSAITSCVPADDIRHRLDASIPVVELDRRPGNDLRLIGHLKGSFARWRPDIVHTHAWGTLVEGLVAARWAGVRAVVHGEHGSLQTRWRHRFVQRAVWARVDRVLSVSQALADRMRSEIGFEAVTTIRNGVDLGRFGAGHRERGRAALGVGAGHLVIGTVGRLVPVKDQGVFLQALARLAAESPDVQGVVVGDGPLRGDLEVLASSLGLAGRLRWLGSRADVPDLMAGFDVFVLSSESEGLSNTILEAMACARPVVATRVGGADELVVDPDTGRLVPPKDPMAMTEALREFLDQRRREEAGRAGRERVERHFDLRRTVDAYRDLYLELARRGRTDLDPTHG